MAKPILGALWQDRKHTLFGLPWSFTKYVLTEEKLFILRGAFNRTEDEIRLYRIMDVTLKRSLGERMEGLGTIHCCSSDKSSPEFDIRRVRDARKVKELLSDLVEKQRVAHGLTIREEMNSNGMDADHDGVNDIVDRHR